MKVLALPDVSTPVAEVLKLVAGGDMTVEEFGQWDALRLKAFEASRPARVVASLTADEFMAQAKPLTLDICGAKVVAKPKTFSTGSYGWGFNVKVDAPVGEGSVKVQVGCNLIVVGSKPAQPAE